MNLGTASPAPLARTGMAATLVTVVVLLLSISGESFWTDEITTATFASKATLSEFWASLATTGSEMQMPLYSHYMWGWARVFGAGELSLRCANIPWMVFLVAAMLQLLARNRIRRTAVLLLTAPLICMQMNEARPYIMTLAASALSLYSLQCLLEAHLAGQPFHRRHTWIFGIATWGCVAISMLNLFILPALGIYALLRLRERCKPSSGEGLEGTKALRAQLGGFLRAHPASLIGLAVGLSTLLIYYMWTLQQGHGGRTLPFRLTNFAFIIYEWLGFGGLGVPRNILREIGPSAAARASYFALLTGVAAWLLFAAALLIARKRLWADLRLSSLIWAGKTGAGILILVAIVMPASFWGRHLLFAWPFIWVGLARWVLPEEPDDPGHASPTTAYRVHSGGRLAPVAFWILIGVFLFSVGRQRFDPAFGKDPYREVVEALRGELEEYRHLPWVWTAYSKALQFYGGQIVDRNAPFEVDASKGRPSLVLGERWGAGAVGAWTDQHEVFLLVLHRPDVTDPDGAWAALAQTGGSQRVWERGNVRVYLIRPEVR